MDGRAVVEDVFEDALLRNSSVKVAEILNLQIGGSSRLTKEMVLDSARLVSARKTKSRLEMEMQRLNWDIAFGDECGGRRKGEWAILPAVGASGGLLSLWDDDVYEVEVVWVGQWCLVSVLRDRRDGFTWKLVNVYGPQDMVQKRLFVLEMQDVWSWWNFPGCLVGDFNMIRCLDETRDRRRSFAEMVMFNDFIEGLGVVDLPLNGAEFTWSDLRVEPSLCRLDRILISSSWEDKYPSCLVRVLPRTCSDHKPLFLSCGGDQRINRPWRFEVMWFSHVDFLPFIKDQWRMSGAGFGKLFYLASKLKRLKASLIRWNQDVFGRVDNLIQDSLAAIQRLDEQEESSVLLESEIVERCLIKCSLDRLWKMEETSWRQKSRDNWIKLGDKNTKYFHRVANARKRCNTLDHLRVDGVVFDNPSSLAEATVEFYRRLYSEDLLVRPFPVGLQFGRVDRAEWVLLEQEERLRFMAFLSALPLDTLSEGLASLRWQLEASGRFSVSSLAKLNIRKKFQGVDDFPSEVV
ncbi:hypothetical protein LINGRAHAP2_LOCUS14836 [Linum grandiflorum]